MRQPIDEGLFIPVNGIEQWIAIRGTARDNPVLLMVTGPGVAFSPLAPFFSPWERDYTVVHWDQPGAGATFSRNGDSGTGPLSLDRLASDGLAVTEWVCQHLGANKVVLVGISGGSIVALRMIARRPALFAAYVGTGQIVNWHVQEALSYEAVMAQARARGDGAAIEELAAIGPPPYDDMAKDLVKSKYAAALTPAEQAAFANLDPAVGAALRTPPPDAAYVSHGLPAVDQRARAMAVFRELRREIVAFDARALGLRFEVPMFFFQGDRDAYTVTSEVEAYASQLRAPAHTVVPIEGGGHSAIFMREDFLASLDRFVRPYL
jgi:pimeloyl-ACP methyl ester carboxylesterase